MIDSLFPDNSPLRVSRVRSYRVPRYPGHDDPDPTTTPRPIPYPWKSGVAAALLALGETSCQRGDGEPDASSPPERVVSRQEMKEIDQIVAAALRENPKGDQNPFAQSLGFSGLPYVSSSFGTGAPMPLDSMVAQRLITQLFAAEGLKPEPTTFTEKDFTATAQGYDPKKRIGFVMGDPENLTDDAMSSGMMDDFKKIATGERKIAPADEKDALVSIDMMSEFLVRGAGKGKELEAIRKLESPQARARAYLDLAAKLDAPKLSMAEIERAEKMAEDRQRYLAVISAFDRRFMGSSVEGEEKLDAIQEKAGQREFKDAKDRLDWMRKQQALVYSEMERERLAELAHSVREYIAWARRNGLQ